MEALAGQPGGAAVLALAGRRGDLMLVGGAVRDLLLGRTPLELDITVAEGAAEVAEMLAGEIDVPAGAEPPLVTVFERFGTACVEFQKGRIDIAQRRRETYPRPGALPEVEAGDLAADLARRDFTLNALAVALAGPDAGVLRAVEKGVEDLKAGLLRVLHGRSFIDDPTRMLRLARYRARMRFEIERRTAELAGEAIASGALQSVSSARIGTELWLAVSEAEPVAALVALDDLGVLRALGLASPFDHMLAEAALRMLPSEASPPELLTAILIASPHASRAEAGRLLDAFEIPAGARERILTSAFASPSMADRIEWDMPPSKLGAVLRSAPLETVALTGALAARRALGADQPVARWLQELRHWRLRIDGEDLLAAGVPQGPQIGLRLAHALDLKLDGEVDDTAEAELEAALRMSL